MAEKTTTNIEATPPTGKTLATREENRYMVPPVDIYETENALAVIVDLPGVHKDGVDIRVDQDILTIKGKIRYKPPKDLIRGEFGLLDFFRQFQLSDEVDQEKITAESKNGVLTITLPKAEKAQPRLVKVKVG
ncbi:MAG: Hsp20/alpha crystallin family protein [Acidobacteriota bacterium]